MRKPRPPGVTRLGAGSAERSYCALVAPGATKSPSGVSPALYALSERQFQAIVKAELERRGYVVMAIPDMRKTVAGWPDLTFWHPELPGSPLHCWELKTMTGKATLKQRATLAWLRAVAGIDARIVRPSDWEHLRDEILEA